VKIALRTTQSTADEFRSLPARMSEALGIPVSLNDAFALGVRLLLDAYAPPRRWEGEARDDEGRVDLPPGPSNVGLKRESRRLLRRIQEELIRRNRMNVCASEVVAEALRRLAEQLGPWVRHGGPRMPAAPVGAEGTSEEAATDIRCKPEADGEVTG
jgi:hypothetical protein